MCCEAVMLGLGLNWPWPNWPEAKMSALALRVVALAMALRHWP